MEQSNKIQRVVNGLSQMNSNAHEKMGELQDKISSCLNLLKSGKKLSENDKEEITTLSDKIAVDLKNMNSSLPTYVEEYSKILSNIAKRVQVIKIRSDFSKEKVNISDSDLDEVLDQFVQIKVEAETMAELPLAKLNGFKLVSRQARQIQEFVEAVAGEKGGDGNTTSSYIKEKLEELENLPETYKTKVDTLVEQTTMDNELIVDYCGKAKEAVSE